MFAVALRRLVASGFVLFASVISAAAADEAATRAAISKLLEVGWATTPQARTAADLQYDEVRRLAGGHPTVLTASLLVLLQQRRFEEAARRADELLAKEAADLIALRAKVWTAAITKNYQAAMVSADKLSAVLADAPPRSDDEQAVHDELHAFLGRIYGFLGGPIADSVNQDTRKASEKQIIERIPESRRAKFEEARDGVVAKFLEMIGDKDEERGRVVAEAQAAKEKTLKELETEREAIAGRTKELEDRRTKAQADLRDQLSEIAKQDQPLIADLARLDARAGSLNRDLFSYDAEIDRLQALIVREKDPNMRLQLQLEADRLSRIAARIQSDLIAVGRLADGVRSQRLALAARQQKAQAAATDQVQRIDQESNNLAKRDKRNDLIEKRASKPASGTTSKVRSLAAQATALSTYDQFPLEAARQKLLESLR